MTDMEMEKIDEVMTPIQKEVADIKKLLQKQFDDYKKMCEIAADCRQAYIRSQYLLENAISYLVDNDLLEDFMSDRDIDFTREEEKYFEIER